jgi:hypothetical protein
MPTPTETRQPPSRGRRAAFILIYVVALGLFTETAARALLRLRSHAGAHPAAGGTPDLEAAGRALGLDPAEALKPGIPVPGPARRASRAR